MAERIITQLLDDLDQTEIADGKGESVEFALRGTTYRIDLKKANIAKLDKAFAPFVAAATQVANPKKSPSAVASPRQRKARSKRVEKATNSTSAVRDWAIANGHDISARGRIPASVQEAYEAAHQASN